MGKVRGKRAPNHGAWKEKVAKADAILEDYKTSFDTIENCCIRNGIAYRTFMDWKDNNAEIAALYAKSKTDKDINYKITLRHESQTALMRGVKGYEFEEVSTVGKQVETGVDAEGQPIFKFVVTQQTKVKKFIKPDATMVIFALTNTNDVEKPEFLHKNQIENKLTLEGLDLSNFTTEELIMIDELSKKLVKK